MSTQTPPKGLTSFLGAAGTAAPVLRDPAGLVKQPEGAVPLHDEQGNVIGTAGEFQRDDKGTVTATLRVPLTDEEKRQESERKALLEIEIALKAGKPIPATGSVYDKPAAASKPAAITQFNAAINAQIAAGADPKTLIVLDEAEGLTAEQYAKMEQTIKPATYTVPQPPTPEERTAAGLPVRAAFKRPGPLAFLRNQGPAVIGVDPGQGDDRTVYGVPAIRQQLDDHLRAKQEELNKYREIAARIWTDPEFSSVAMDVKACELIAKILHTVATDARLVHTLVVIGGDGTCAAYLDVPEVVALARYIREVGTPEEVLRRRGQVRSFEFEEEFLCSDAWRRKDPEPRPVSPRT